MKKMFILAGGLGTATPKTRRPGKRKQRKEVRVDLQADGDHHRLGKPEWGADDLEKYPEKIQLTMINN